MKEEDVYICPRTGIVLSYRNIDKNGYKQYYDRKQCEGCSYQKECCGNNKFRTIRRFINEEINEKARERRLSKEGKELLKKRKITVERSFGDSKQNHGYRYTLYKGVERNQSYTHLICAAQNMKNIAIKQEKVDGISLFLTTLLEKITKILKKISNFKFLKFHKKTSRKILGVCLHSDFKIIYYNFEVLFKLLLISYYKTRGSVNISNTCHTIKCEYS